MGNKVHISCCLALLLISPFRIFYYIYLEYIVWMLSNFTTESINDVSIVTTHLEEATIEHAIEFNKLLSDIIENGGHKILIEMSEVKFIDSTFLGSLIINLRKINAVKGKFILVGLSTYVKATILQTNLNNIFEIFPSREEALKNI